MQCAWPRGLCYYNFVLSVSSFCLKPNQSQNTNWPFDVLHKIDLCRSDFLFLNTKLDVRRAGMWPSSRSAVKPANMPVTSPAANHVHFDVQNPTADSTAWSREKPF